MVAEQNMDIMEEIEMLKKDFKGAFVALAEHMESSMQSLLGNVTETTAMKRNQTEDAKLNHKIETDVNEVKQSKKVEKKSDDTNDNVNEIRKPKKKNYHNLTWVGTSISKSLDMKKFETDNNVKINMVKAYSITDEVHTPYPKDNFRFPDTNFKSVLPKVLEDDSIDTLVLQTGSIEISNIKVNEAVMDASKEISKYKEEWFNQVETDTKNLFTLAEEAVGKNPNLNVIIVKRLPRYDRSSRDIIGIKSQLSTYANSIYDQLWLKKGSPGNIHIVEVDLKCSNSRYLKSLIFGDPNTNYFDGVHLKGPGASRHFTYRVNQVLKPVLQRHNANRRFSSPPPPIRTQKVRSQPIKSEQMSATSNHTNCEQAQYKRRQLLRHKPSYAQVVQDGYYSVTTSNRYEHLNY